MPIIRLPAVGGCFEDPPEGFEPFDIECLDVDDISPRDIKPGGRSVIVTPHVGRVCTGCYGQFQILNGLGGQIHRAMYVGDTVEFCDDGSPSGICTECNESGSDCIEPGERGIAVRDRGRWYVTKLGDTTEVKIYMTRGGNLNIDNAGISGIKRVTETISSIAVPSGPPSSIPELRDGLGVAVEVFTGSWVYACNDADASVGISLFETQLFFAHESKTLDTSDGGSINCVLPFAAV